MKWENKILILVLVLIIFLLYMLACLVYHANAKWYKRRPPTAPPSPIPFPWHLLPLPFSFFLCHTHTQKIEENEERVLKF